MGNTPDKNTTEKPTDDESARGFYRVPCEFQVRFRIMADEELSVFSSFALRPSPYSTLKGEIDTQISTMSIRDESKTLFEKAFQILLNIDQRLERLEEQISAIADGEKQRVYENYEWVHGDLGAGGVAFVTEHPKDIRVAQKLLLDFILPSLPEHRIVAAVEVIYTDQAGKIGTHFLSIHQDDREFIHRFVVSRERELLRLRATEKKTTSPDSPKK